MDTINNLPTATLEEAFELRPAKKITKISLYESKMNNNSFDSGTLQIQDAPEPLETQYVHKSFIEANTEEVTLKHLQNDCIIPVFRDSEQTIAHFQLINTVQECVEKAFPYHSAGIPEIRVSHRVSGRIPEALHKPVKELLDNEKTLFWERMAFIIRIPSITDTINGNELSLTIGGIRNYKSSNLFNKKSMEHFKVFCGFQVKVCSNLCVWSDGFVDDLRASSVQELGNQILQLLQNYNAEKHLLEMKEFADYSLTEHQFAQLIGRTRLYQHLPKVEKLALPALNFNDGHINTIAKDYYEDESFSRDNGGNINLWNVYNLFTQANKSSYIDTFLDRNLNAFDFTKGIQQTLNGNSDYRWFLS